MLTVGSLFAGIGGLDLGLERAGMQVKWQVENDPYCIRVLEKHWPSVKRYGDVREIDWKAVEPVDLICGGFPCQPVSVAGSRKGDKDERWLWPEFLRAIREVRPKYTLVENVPGLLSIDDGRLARRIKGDLAEQGYDSEQGCVSAQDVGAPHLRKRIFIVAYSHCGRGSREAWSGKCNCRGMSGKEPNCNADEASQRRGATVAYPLDTRRGKEPIVFTERFYSSFPWYDGETESLENSRQPSWFEGAEVEGIISGFIEEGSSRGEPSGPSEARVPDTECEGWWEEHIPETRQIARLCEDVSDSESNLRRALGDERPIALNRSSTKFGGQWSVEPSVGRVADGVPSRVDRLRCLGNAVVPQVAEFVGKAIIEAHERK